MARGPDDGDVDDDASVSDNVVEFPLSLNAQSRLLSSETRRLIAKLKAQNETEDLLIAKLAELKKTMVRTDIALGEHGAPVPAPSLSPSPSGRGRLRMSAPNGPSITQQLVGWVRDHPELTGVAAGLGIVAAVSYAVRKKAQDRPQPLARRPLGRPS